MTEERVEDFKRVGKLIEELVWALENADITPIQAVLTAYQQGVEDGVRKEAASEIVRRALSKLTAEELAKLDNA